MPGDSLIVVKVSAPGKVILHGEHSVVYGKLAIAASLDLRTTVSLYEKQNNKLEVHFTDLKLRKKFDIKEIRTIFETNSFPLLENKSDFNYQHPDVLDHTEYIKTITSALKLDADDLEQTQYLSLLSFFYLYFGILHSSKIPILPLNITIKTELSLGSGTGSSASLMVSLAGCLIRYLTCKSPELKLSTNAQNNSELSTNEKVSEQFNELELNLISKWAFAAERIIHGNPSGIDNTVCTYGSMVSFRKGRAPFAVKCRNDIHGLLIDSKVPKNTKVMVQKVADLRKKRVKIINAVLDAMEDLTDEALEVLVHLGELNENKHEEFKKCYDNLGELFDLNHNLLRTLGVSHPSLDNIVQIVNKHGLYGKLTGAGGGGYAIALLPPSVPPDTIEQLRIELTEQGYHPQVTKLGGVGARVEQQASQ